MHPSDINEYLYFNTHENRPSSFGGDGNKLYGPRYYYNR